MKIEYQIKEVKPNIFAVIIENNYDRAMTFCRVQEFYESPNTKFRGKQFSMWDYMKWYSEEYGKGFSYGNDWAGFNIPFDVLEICYRDMKEFETPYDEVMYKIYWTIQTQKSKGKAYIIGTGNTTGDTFRHEVCHGLWHTNSAFKKESKIVLSTIDPNHRSIFRQNLLDMGYADTVIDDEIQAYLTINWDYNRFGNGVEISDRRKYNNAFSLVLNEFIN
jgi:hypothetical protein